MKTLLNFVILIAIVVIGTYYHIRLSNLEARFGGRQKLNCSPNTITQTVSPKLVRIIGSYGEGTGFPLTDSIILTNFHVIEGESSPKVVFTDGAIETPVKITGDRQKDIAALTLERKLEPLPFFGWMGTSNNFREPALDEPVYALGYPLGSQIKGNPSIIKGAYSGKRIMEFPDMTMISSDISLVKGMSGGPLVDSCGQVIGVNTLGIGGISMFIDIASVQSSIQATTGKEIEKQEINTSTPLGAVEAFYANLKSRNLKAAYALMHPERIAGDSLEHWSQGYTSTLQVDLVQIKTDENDINKIWVKLASLDWEDDETVTNYFEGSWIVEGLKLKESSIKQITDPDWSWFYGWDEDE